MGDGGNPESWPLNCPEILRHSKKKPRLIGAAHSVLVRSDSIGRRLSGNSFKFKRNPQTKISGSPTAKKIRTGSDELAAMPANSFRLKRFPIRTVLVKQNENIKTVCFKCEQR